MIEQALLQHLQAQAALRPFLAEYAGQMAIFNQEAPSDQDVLWGCGSQYGRIVFSVDLQGDPERDTGGILAVDILCEKDKQFPEDIEPILRPLIHGYFFSSGTFTVAAQWRNSTPFTQADDRVIGCTMTFNLLGFPIMTTVIPDVIARLNEWTAAFPNIHVINHDALPAAAWKPTGEESAVFWRCGPEVPAGWIPDTFQTIWRKTTVKGHIFSKDNSVMGTAARNIIYQLYTDKRLLKAGETPIMVNPKNSIDYGADPLRSGQLTVEATFGIIVYTAPDNNLEHIKYD